MSDDRAGGALIIAYIVAQYTMHTVHTDYGMVRWLSHEDWNLEIG